MRLVYLIVPVLLCVAAVLSSPRRRKAEDEATEVGEAGSAAGRPQRAHHSTAGHKRGKGKHKKKKKRTTKKPVASALVVSKSCKCGVSGNSTTSTKDDHRIVGGTNAAQGEFPWQAALVANGEKSPFCGGTLVSTKSVICASHCYTPVSQFKVVLGLNDYTQNTGQKSFTPVSFVTNPSFNMQTVDWDYAVITLSQPVTFTSTMSPVCLPAQTGSYYDNKMLTVTGWGTLYSNGPQPNVLQKVNVMAITNAACTSKPNIYTSQQVTDRMICADSPGKDSCQGDSGGPLVYQTSAGHFELIGIVSWGVGCAQTNAPGVYERVTVGLSWLQSLMTGTVCST